MPRRSLWLTTRSVSTEGAVMRKDLIRPFAVALLLLMGVAGYFCIKFASNPFASVVTGDIRIGVLFDGKLNDGGWNEAQRIGFEYLKQNMKVQVVYRDSLPHVDAANMRVENDVRGDEKTVDEETALHIVDQLVRADRATIVFSTSEVYASAIEKAVQKYSNVKFFQLKGKKAHGNLATYYARMYQACYLSGIVAGRQTETGHIGYVSSFPNSEQIRVVNAFTLGVQSVNPQAVVHLRWSRAYSDVEWEKAVANKLMDDFPVDVIATNLDTISVLEAADARGVKSIGYNMEHTDMYPNTFLTASVWHWDKFYEARLRECMEGRFKGTMYFADISEGFFGLSELSPLVKPGTANLVETAMGRFRSGKWDVFYGPIYDQNGVLRVAGDENMSDNEVSQHFDWLVRGVEGSCGEDG